MTYGGPEQITEANAREFAESMMRTLHDPHAPPTAIQLSIAVAHSFLLNAIRLNHPVASYGALMGSFGAIFTICPVETHDEVAAMIRRTLDHVQACFAGGHPANRSLN